MPEFPQSLPLLRRIGLIAFFATGLALSGCAGPPVVGCGVIRTETRPISGACAIDLAISGELEIEQGATDSLSVEADDNILPLIVTTMRGDTLVITTKSGAGEIRPHALRYHIVVQSLRAVRLRFPHG